MKDMIAEKIQKVNELLCASYNEGTDDEYEVVLDVILGEFRILEKAGVVRISFEASDDNTCETIISQIDVELCVFEKDVGYIYEEILYLVEEAFACAVDPHSH